MDLPEGLCRICGKRIYSGKMNHPLSFLVPPFTSWFPVPLDSSSSVHTDRTQKSIRLVLYELTRLLRSAVRWHCPSDVQASLATGQKMCQLSDSAE
jgi:hypothetical protein